MTKIYILLHVSSVFVVIVGPGLDHIINNKFVYDHSMFTLDSGAGHGFPSTKRLVNPL